MSRTLPALISRPLLAVTAPPPDPAVQVVRQELTAGLPVRIDLDAARALVLAVPLGVARAVLAADPSAVVFTTADPGDGTAFREYAAAWPRLTLLVTGAIGATVPVVAGVGVRLTGAPGTAAVEVTVDELVLTAGSLRSPGRFGSRLSLRWRDLAPAPDDGPPHPVGDPGVPVLLSQLGKER